MNDDISGSRVAALDYMQAMLGQLRAMAEAHACDVLAYLIDMAHVEAGDIVRSETTRPGHGRKRSGAI